MGLEISKELHLTVCQQVGIYIYCFLTLLAQAALFLAILFTYTEYSYDTEGSLILSKMICAALILIIIAKEVIEGLSKVTYLVSFSANRFY